MKIFNTEKIQLFKKALNVYYKQHKAIAQNVAHAHDNTYRPVKTDFSEQLQTAVAEKLKKTDPRHLNSRGPGEFPSLEKTRERVDLNKEMGVLAENQIRFDFVSRILSRTYKSLNTSITGRTT